MNDVDNNPPVGNWHCGGWEGAELETLRAMSALTFEQKLDWLEQAQRLIADLHGWEAALQPNGTLARIVREQRKQSGIKPDH